jgi:hypothetical protein
MNTNINELLDKELSRKEFLKFFAGGFIVLLGMHNFVSYLTQFNRTNSTAVTNLTSHGFGSRKFGG